MTFTTRNTRFDCDARHVRIRAAPSPRSPEEVVCFPNVGHDYVDRFSCGLVATPHQRSTPDDAVSSWLAKQASKILGTTARHSVGSGLALLHPSMFVCRLPVHRSLLILPSSPVTVRSRRLVRGSTHRLYSPTRSAMAVDGTPPAMSTLALLLEFLRGEKSNHAWWSRFFVAMWGCLILHVVLVGVGNAHDIISPRLLDPSGYLFELSGAILVYSGVFATIVAVGIPHGSLVRHFSFGVTLPTFAYLIAGTISAFIRG